MQFELICPLLEQVRKRMAHTLNLPSLAPIARTDAFSSFLA